MTLRPRVVFTPSGRSGSVVPGTTVLDAAREMGVDLDSVCAGRGHCGRCQVFAVAGEFPKWRLTATHDALSAPAALERDYQGARPLLAGARLGCAARIEGDAVLDVPPASQVHRPIVRKTLELGAVEVDPIVTLHYVELGPDDTLRTALRSQHHLDVEVEVAGAGEPPVPMDGALTVAVRHVDGRATAVAQYPGYHDRAVGIAFDIGSTTIAGYACDLATGEVLADAGRMNPQLRYGEDLMSRVSHVMLHDDGAAVLTAAVRGALDELAGELCDAAGAARDHVLDVVLVGNPIMHHLALGLDVRPLGVAPFTLATAGPVHRDATALDLALPNAQCYAAPCIAGHVGADAAAALLADETGAASPDGAHLLVDVGTNAEIILRCGAARFAASSPTGPAFEGAQISCGQRATAGAIERVRIDPATLEPRWQVIGSPGWHTNATCTPGNLPTGVCGSGIVEAIVELHAAGVIDAHGAVDPSAAARSPRVVADGRTFAYVLVDSGQPLRITQADVRAVQLAKAALRAGIELVHEHAGRPPIDSIAIAGGFGAQIDPRYAVALGLIPDVAVDRIRSIGNAAGAGAVLALVSHALRERLERSVREVVKIETATEPGFQAEFVAALAIPHGSVAGPPVGRARVRARSRR
jgi:uncharacterized 2Fe-2S/4Fe-4S cluster protein (DUF4445 family)